MNEGSFLDPRIEKFYSVSSYDNFNRPNNNVDPNGEEAYTLVGSAAETAFRMMQAIMGGGPILGMRNHFVLESVTPNIYHNTIEAIKMGKPYLLTWNPDKEGVNRRWALNSYSGPDPRKNVESLDEYPLRVLMKVGFIWDLTFAFRQSQTRKIQYRKAILGD